MNQYHSGLIVPNPDAAWRKTSSGLFIPGGLKIKPQFPVAIDLFAGCGGFSLGMMQAGVQVLAACDISVSAAVTYTVNLGTYPMRFEFIEPKDKEKMEKFLTKSYEHSSKAWEKWFADGGEGKPPVPPITTGQGWIQNADNKIPGVQVFFVGDIRKLTGERILKSIGYERGEIDIVCGGPPCQGFSTAGKRDIMDPRNSLVFDFARLVLEICPKTMVMENVPEIASMITPEGIPVLDAFYRILEDGSFGNFDSLKRSISATAGIGGALRKDNKNQKSTKRSRDRKIESKKSSQLEFGLVNK